MNEGFSMPVIEALACGSPVVVSDIPAHQELVQDNEYRFQKKMPEYCRKTQAFFYIIEPTKKGGTIATIDCKEIYKTCCCQTFL